MKGFCALLLLDGRRLVGTAAGSGEETLLRAAMGAAYPGRGAAMFIGCWVPALRIEGRGTAVAAANAAFLDAGGEEDSDLDVDSDSELSNSSSSSSMANKPAPTPLIPE
jgi:hypothetical protein